MKIENQVMLMSIWENLHRIANDGNFFIKNPEMDAITGACEALRPLIYKIQEGEMKYIDINSILPNEEAAEQKQAFDDDYGNLMYECLKDTDFAEMEAERLEAAL